MCAAPAISQLSAEESSEKEQRSTCPRESPYRRVGPRELTMRSLVSWGCLEAPARHLTGYGRLSLTSMRSTPRSSNQRLARYTPMCRDPIPQEVGSLSAAG